MPILESNYKPPIGFKNGFVSTVYSGLIRQVKGVEQRRERISLSDGDFMDIDWSYSKNTSEKLIILLHGLEGDSKRHYMLGTAKIFNANGFDAVCVNFRGCSGEENTKYRSYHSGATEDLEDVINHILKTKNYQEIVLKGFSLGGNVVLKYLGECQDISFHIKAGIAISVPCYLQGSALELHTTKNVLYHERFKRHLKHKLKLKQRQFPDLLTDDDIKKIKTLTHFDEIYTSKAHGFMDAVDYYEKSSSLQYLPNIKVPTLIINALNDSFLSPECYPVKAAKNNPNLYLEMPKYGGHVGFVGKHNIYYSEKRALEFVFEVIHNK